MEIETDQPASGGEPALSQADAPPSIPPQTLPAATGLTPDQVFQEFKKSGFLDQLRRQMFDAYVSSALPASHPPAAPSSSASVPSIPAESPVNATDTVAPAADPPTISTSSEAPLPGPQPPTLATAHTATPAANAQPPSALSSKQALTSYLDTILRPQLEKEHDRLRFQDPRNQLDTLLKFLDSDPVAAAQHGGQEATLYEQLTAHVAKDAPNPQEAATKGMLNKEGRVGKEVSQRIAELITDLRNPGAKAGDDDEDDEDDADKTVDQSTHQTEAVDMDV